MVRVAVSLALMGYRMYQCAGERRGIRCLQLRSNVVCPAYAAYDWIRRLNDESR